MGRAGGTTWCSPLQGERSAYATVLLAGRMSAMKRTFVRGVCCPLAGLPLGLHVALAASSRPWGAALSRYPLSPTPLLTCYPLSLALLRDAAKLTFYARFLANVAVQMHRAHICRGDAVGSAQRLARRGQPTF